MQTETTSEESILLMQAVIANMGLPRWFFSLETVPKNLRYSHIRSVAERMQADMVNPDLVEAVKFLVSPRVYKAAARTIHDFSQ